MGVLKSFGCFGFILLVFFSGQSTAAGFDDDEEKPWVEMEVQLPGFPEQENLIPFTVGSVSDTRYLIDGNSISVGGDEVIRFTLVVISSAGAQNISYEGMRCATAERRIYAFGRSDKTWSKARSSKWSRIQGGSNNHYVELFTNYFCTIGVSAIMKADDARRVLRNRR